NVRVEDRGVLGVDLRLDLLAQRLDFRLRGFARRREALHLGGRVGRGAPGDGQLRGLKPKRRAAGNALSRGDAPVGYFVHQDLVPLSGCESSVSTKKRRGGRARLSPRRALRPSAR